MGRAGRDDGQRGGRLRTMAKMRGWKQAPPNDEDGVAVMLEAALRPAGKRTNGQQWATTAGVEDAECDSYRR